MGKKKNATILVADDEPVVIRVLGRTITRAGYSCKSAPNGEKALEIFKQGGIDLVISDRQMTNMNGLTLLIEIKRLDPDVKVVIVSGGISEKEVAVFMEAGAAMVLRKPFLPSDIKEIFERYL
jgi:two-component system cell cycle sensor histidine kinase/response regulator CckA